MPFFTHPENEGELVEAVVTLAESFQRLSVAFETYVVKQCQLMDQTMAALKDSAPPKSPY